MRKNIFKIDSVDPAITPYNFTNSQSLPLYNMSLDNTEITYKREVLFKVKVKVKSFISIRPLKGTFERQLHNNSESSCPFQRVASYGEERYL